MNLPIRYLFLVCIIGLVSFMGCIEGDKSIPEFQKGKDAYKEPLIDANKARLKMENKKIERFIERNGWSIQTTGTGLRYLIYEKGLGKQPTIGTTAIINYEVKLIDGTLCYSSKINGTKGVELGKAQIERGVDEGILLMHVGDKAKFILPSHLAHGLVGDGNKIPSHSVLVYDVQLVDIK